MDDSPAKYENQNHTIESKSNHQNFADPEINYNLSGSIGTAKKKKRKSKKKKDQGLVQVKQFYESDIMMADAYGGVAQPRVRMVPKRFASVHRERVGNRKYPVQMQNLTTSNNGIYAAFTAKQMESQKNALSSVNDDITNAASRAAEGKSNVVSGSNDMTINRRDLNIQNQKSSA